MWHRKSISNILENLISTKCMLDKSKGLRVRHTWVQIPVQHSLTVWSIFTFGRLMQSVRDCNFAGCPKQVPVLPLPGSNPLFLKSLTTSLSTSPRSCLRPHRRGDIPSQRINMAVWYWAVIKDFKLLYLPRMVSPMLDSGKRK